MIMARSRERIEIFAIREIIEKIRKIQILLYLQPKNHAPIFPLILHPGMTTYPCNSRRE